MKIVEPMVDAAFGVAAVGLLLAAEIVAELLASVLIAVLP